MLSRQISRIFLAAALTAAIGAVQATETRLPNLGSSAGQIASPEQQRQYGFYVLHELRNHSGVLDDALLGDYLNTLGYRLVANSAQPDQPFTFFVVRDNDINAFALPGGFVGVNAGLITTSETENELAAVLAHEISHVTQNHLIRAVEAEQKMTPLMILAMIGAARSPRCRGSRSRCRSILRARMNPRPTVSASTRWRRPVSTPRRWRTFSSACSVRCAPASTKTTCRHC
ncbi:MAG: hypothetical protein E6K53_00865 [Gammaproteobacteria bacterium]|nr:MAG: hypothetical protein E6K53_00865 [Gammaproteobacteria bacterium]